MKRAWYFLCILWESKPYELQQHSMLNCELKLPLQWGMEWTRLKVIPVVFRFPLVSKLKLWGWSEQSFQGQFICFLILYDEFNPGTMVTTHFQCAMGLKLSQKQHHTWVEFAVSLLLCSDVFSLSLRVPQSSKKTKYQSFQFDTHFGQIRECPQV